MNASTRWIAIVLGGSLCVAAPVAAQSPKPGDVLAQNVVAHVDGIFYEGEQPFVLGWACQPGNKDSVEIRIYADAPKGAFVLAGRADFESDSGVSNACRDREGKHRFKLPLPNSMFVKGHERKLYADVIPPKGAPPAVAGTYRHPAMHPWVFTTPSELEDLARRSNIPGSYSAARLGQLAGQIARDLAARNDWNAVYTGCDAGTRWLNGISTLNSSSRPGRQSSAGRCVTHGLPSRPWNS
jgi:hypothetical protein